MGPLTGRLNPICIAFVPSVGSWQATRAPGWGRAGGACVGGQGAMPGPIGGRLALARGNVELAGAHCARQEASLAMRRGLGRASHGTEALLRDMQRALPQ